MTNQDTEIAVLKDLLETAYRKVDEARLESEKADDEALRHKSENMRLKLGLMADGVDLVWAWKRRAEAAEAKLKAMKK